MKLFLDDVREPPDNSWTVCRLPIEVIEMMESHDISIVSLDHDLGLCDITGMYVLNWIEEKMHFDELWIPPLILIHSANPIALERMLKVTRKIYTERTFRLDRVHLP